MHRGPPLDLPRAEKNLIMKNYSKLWQKVYTFVLSVITYVPLPQDALVPNVITHIPLSETILHLTFKSDLVNR